MFYDLVWPRSGPAVSQTTLLLTRSPSLKEDHPAHPTGLCNLRCESPSAAPGRREVLTGMGGRRAGEPREGAGEEGSPGATLPSARTGGIQGVAAAADRPETGTLPAGSKAGAVGNRDSAKTDLGTVTQRKAAGDRDSARRAGKGLLSRAGGARPRALAPGRPAGWGRLSGLDPLTPPYRLTFLSSANSANRAGLATGRLK